MSLSPCLGTLPISGTERMRLQASLIMPSLQKRTSVYGEPPEVSRSEHKVATPIAGAKHC